MKRLRFIIWPLALALLVGSLGSAARPAAAQDDGWQSVGDGIAFKSFYLQDPAVVYVARMDRSNPSVTIESALAKGRIASGTETVANMARRYDESLSYWGGTWGKRSHVVVAINGSFFTGGGNPIDEVVQGGWYVRRARDMAARSGFAWKLDGSAFMGQCVQNRPEKQVVTFRGTGKTQNIDALNLPRDTDQLVLYTPQYGLTTGTNNSGVEVLVEMMEPALITGAGAEGFIREIREGKGSTQMDFDQVVLSGHGAAAAALLNNARVGDTVHISQEITHTKVDCETPNDDDWSQTYASVGGAATILGDGEVWSLPDNAGAQARNPLTAVSFNDQYIFFVVVDGRNPNYSIGLNYDQLAVFTRDYLQAKWTMAQDGGGSSTMVINGQVVNHPVSACYVNFLPAISQGPVPGETPAPPSAPPIVNDPRNTCQREVANGLMMVNVEPEEKSTTLEAGMTVETTTPVYLRSGPGDNYLAFAVLPAGVKGVVLPHTNNLEGIFARNNYWWKVNVVNYGIGWITEDALKVAGIAPSQVPDDQ